MVKKQLQKIIMIFFTKTVEFERIIKRINIYKSIYNNLFNKYNEFEKELNPYKKFIQKEKDNFDEIMYGKRIEFFNEIFPLIDDDIKLKILNKNLTLQEDIIVGNRDLSEKTSLEYFSEEDINILKSDEYSIDDKYWIMFFQSNYLRSLDVNINEDLLFCQNSDDVNKYLDFIYSEDIVKLIPTQDVILTINEKRNVKYNEVINNYYTQREDFMYNIKYFVDNEYNRKFLLTQILNNEICVLSCGGRNTNSEFLSLMFFTIKKSHGDKLLHCFTHEIGHIIDQT